LISSIIDWIPLVAVIDAFSVIDTVIWISSSNSPDTSVTIIALTISICSFSISLFMAITFLTLFELLVSLMRARKIWISGVPFWPLLANLLAALMAAFPTLLESLMLRILVLEGRIGILQGSPSFAIRLTMLLVLSAND